MLSLFPFWFFAFAFKFGAGLHYTLLPTLGEQVFPVWLVGVMVGASAFVQLLLDVPAGILLDRYGYTKLLFLGTSFFLIAALFLLFGLHPWTFWGTLIFQTLGWLFYAPGVDAYLLSTAPVSFAGRFMAVRDVVQSAGIVAGMALLSFIVHSSTFVIALTIAGILFFALAAIMWTPAIKPLAHQHSKIAHHSFYIRRRYIHHIVVSLKKLNPASTLLLLSSLSGATFYGIVWFIVPLLIARGIQNQTLGIGLATFDLSVMVVGYFIGKLTDHWSKRALVFWGLLLFALMALWIGLDFGWLFVIIGFLATTGDEIASVSLWAWLDILDKEHAEDALITGSLSLAQDLGWTIGPIVAGLLFATIGPTKTIMCGSIPIFITWLFCALWTHHLPKDPFARLPLFHAPKQRRHKR